MRKITASERTFYLREIERRKALPTRKYIMHSVIAVLAVLLGLVPILALPSQRALILLIPGLLLSILGLAQLIVSGFALRDRYRAWSSQRS